MAYAFGFPRGVTDLIYQMRDWRWEMVRREGGTPSRLALKPFRIWNYKVDIPQTGSDQAVLADHGYYWIHVTKLCPDPDIYVLSLGDDIWHRCWDNDWADNVDKGNDGTATKHGPLVCLR
jgi:hypothetical protein